MRYRGKNIQLDEQTDERNSLKTHSFADTGGCKRHTNTTKSCAGCSCSYYLCK